MKKYRTRNDVLLANYFRSRAAARRRVFSLTQVARATNVSIATISRFARRSGFADWPDFRKNFNAAMHLESQPNSLTRFLQTTLKPPRAEVVIFSSTFSKIIGILLSDRLRELNIKVTLHIGNVSEEVDLQKKRVIFTTVSGHFSQYEKHHSRADAFLLISFFNSYNIPAANIYLLEAKIAADRIDEFQLVRHMYKHVDLTINEVWKNAKPPLVQR